jgi:hypothetical protein
MRQGLPAAQEPRLGKPTVYRRLRSQVSAESVLLESDGVENSVRLDVAEARRNAIRFAAEP